MNTGTIDNKFKFITIAAARCNQLQRGALPRVEARSRKPVTLAMEEVRRGMVDYRVPEDVKEGPSGTVAEVTLEAGSDG